MKTNAYIALISFVIFTVINLFGGLVNEAKGYVWNMSDVIRVIPLHLVYCFLFWLTCIPNIKIRKTYRLPILRMIFWILIALSYWMNNSGIGQTATGDFIFDIIPAFCFFVNTVGINLNNIEILSNSNVYLIGVLIIGVTVYQILVLELSTRIMNRVKRN